MNEAPKALLLLVASGLLLIGIRFVNNMDTLVWWSMIAGTLVFAKALHWLAESVPDDTDPALPACTYCNYVAGTNPDCKACTATRTAMKYMEERFPNSDFKFGGTQRLDGDD